MTDAENLRRNYLQISEFWDNPPLPFLIETYTLPFRFIELQKQIGDKYDYRNEHMKWIIHSEDLVLDTISSQNESIKDFQYFKEYTQSKEVKITRVLKYPLLFRQSVCCISIHVWIDCLDPFTAFIYSEPLLTLLKEPEIFGQKSVFNNKYSFKQVVNLLKKDLEKPKLEKDLWNDL